MNEKEFIERFNYWVMNRGAYIISAHYRKELKEFLLTGKSIGLGDIEELRKEDESD